MAAFLTDQKQPVNNLRSGFCAPLRGTGGVVSRPPGPAPGAAELAEDGTDQVFAVVMLSVSGRGQTQKQVDTQHHNRITNSDGALEGQHGVVEKTGGSALDGVLAQACRTRLTPPGETFSPSPAAGDVTGEPELGVVGAFTLLTAVGNRVMILSARRCRTGVSGSLVTCTRLHDRPRFWLPF